MIEFFKAGSKQSSMRLSFLMISLCISISLLCLNVYIFVAENPDFVSMAAYIGSLGALLGANSYFKVNQLDKENKNNTDTDVK